MTDDRVAQLEREIARLQAELEERQGSVSERNFRALYEHSFEFIGLLDSDGTVIEVNPTALHFAGTAESQVVGRPFWDTPWWAHAPQEQTRLKDAIASARKGEFVRFETTHVGVDGKVHIIDFSIMPVKDEHGEVVHLIPEGRDITDKRVTEAALQCTIVDTEQRVALRTAELSRANEALSARLRELEESGATLRRLMAELEAVQRQLQNNVHYLNSIIHNLPICVKLVDADGRLVDMNPAGRAMLGIGEALQVNGLELVTVVHPEDRDRFSDFNRQVCSGMGGTLRFRVLDVAGSEHILETVAVPIPNPSGPGILHLGLTRDLTAALEQEREAKAMEARLHESEKLEALGTLAGGVAHDFNNILTAILGCAELLRSRLRDTGVPSEVEQIRTAALRAKDLARQILTFSRRKETQLQPEYLQPIVQEALRLLRAAIPANVAIAEEIDPDCGPVMADATQIHQIVMNLGTNAWLAMRDTGGTLRVELREADSCPTGASRCACLAVGDQGIGVAPEIASRIFEPYFTTRDNAGGSGLGLSVVHGIVKSHHGEILVQSTPGRGAVFSVYLPLALQREK